MTDTFFKFLIHSEGEKKVMGGDRNEVKKQKIQRRFFPGFFYF
jgi:hypothetical protein